MELDIYVGEHKKPPFLSLNPIRQIPALKGDHVSTRYIPLNKIRTRLVRASLFKSLMWKSARLLFLFAARSTCFCNLGIHVRQYDLIGTCQSTLGTF